jgi:hypothetical protein
MIQVRRRSHPVEAWHAPNVPETSPQPARGLGHDLGDHHDPRASTFVVAGCTAKEPGDGVAVLD